MSKAQETMKIYENMITVNNRLKSFLFSPMMSKICMILNYAKVNTAIEIFVCGQGNESFLEYFTNFYNKNLSMSN